MATEWAGKQFSQEPGGVGRPRTLPHGGLLVGSRADCLGQGHAGSSGPGVLAIHLGPEDSVWW